MKTQLQKNCNTIPNRKEVEKLKKIKAGFRRTICILLAAVSLSMSVTSSYYGATTAYAAEAGISIELLELLLASLGFTATNMDDLYSVQDRKSVV